MAPVPTTTVIPPAGEWAVYDSDNNVCMNMTFSCEFQIKYITSAMEQVGARQMVLFSPEYRRDLVIIHNTMYVCMQGVFHKDVHSSYVEFIRPVLVYQRNSRSVA